MAKRNYNKISTQPKAEDITTIIPEEVKPVVISDETDVVNPEAQEAKKSVGVVTNCARLNIRREPSVGSTIVCEAQFASELMIDADSSTDDWFRVRTAAGNEGYCMKKFVAVQQ